MAQDGEHLSQAHSVGIAACGVGDLHVEVVGWKLSVADGYEGGLLQTVSEIKEWGYRHTHGFNQEGWLSASKHEG